MSQKDCLPIEIDGQALQVEPGLTILEAARRAGIEIPTLCDFPGLPAHGSCRLCVVEIAGRENTPTACTTPVETGMRISTHSPRVVALRKELIQMLLAEHPSGCLYCPEKDHCDECMVTLRKSGVTTGCGSCSKDGQCELQVLAERYEVHQPAYPMRYRVLPVETGDPFFDRDPNLCILCGRCIRICQQLHLTNTLTYNGRGARALVSTAFGRSHLESSCVFCGSCVEICPTGALSEKTRKWDGRPDRETPSTCPFCSIGCQITLLSKTDRVIGSLPNRAAGTDVLCVSGRFGVTELVDPTTRLKQPQRRYGQHWQPVDWDEAVNLAAGSLAACPPERFELHISAHCTHEDLFVARQFAREVMHSRPLLASARQRYGSSLGSLTRLLRASVPLDQVAGAPVILSLGLDDPYSQSVVSVRLKQARERGAKLIHLGAETHPRGLDWSDVRLPAGDTAGAALAGTLAALVERVTAGSGPANSPAVEQAARLLTQSGPPLILVGASVLAGPRNDTILQSVETLALSLSARVALLPEESNLAGALRLGLGDSSSPDGQPPSTLDVLYLIGEPLPPGQAGTPFVISHALALPDGGAFDGLLFPAAAFCEVNGTSLDQAGRLRVFRPALPPPGSALPAWDILARIARKMGAPGFDYHGLEDIWQAAQAEFPGFPASHTCPVHPDRAHPLHGPAAGWQEPLYMSQPLSRRVAGLRSLYSGSGSARAHEPDS